MCLEFQATVRDLSQKGLGVIDHPDGTVFFARGCWPGDVGIFEITSDSKKYDEAKLKKILIPSESRQNVPCPHRGPKPGQCGGCPWMIADYRSQLKYKTKRFFHALRKRGVNDFLSVTREIIPSEKIYQYRNRAQFKCDGEKLGFVSEGTSRFSPIENCHVLNEKTHHLFLKLYDELKIKKNQISLLSSLKPTPDIIGRMWILMTRWSGKILSPIKEDLLSKGIVFKT